MKYKLENRAGKRKYTCPSCQMEKRFTLYVDNATGEYISEHVGICDRINNCGYHFTPLQFFKDANVNILQPKPIYPKYLEPNHIEYALLKKSIESNIYGKEDNFTAFLKSKFGNEQAQKLKRRYQIGKSALWPGATVFWQTDANRKIRSGKIMCYDEKTGNRIKGRNSWVHSQLIRKGYLTTYNLSQCYFGEHLLVDCPSLPVAIVESEKTAIICSHSFPTLIWLAAGSINGINLEKSRVLRGRKVILFPDLKALEIWQKKAKQLREVLGLNVRVFEWLEKNASAIDQSKGLDIADYLIQGPCK